MTAEELKDVIVYLQDKIEKLESQKLCECSTTEKTPKEMFVTNYNEDEECLTCSA